MPSLFNSREWDQKIRDPFWYKEVPEVMKNLTKLHEENRAEYEKVKEEIYDFFEDRLRNGKIALGSIGKNFDAERKPIDTVVIHHTSMKPGLSKDRLSAIGLLRLYAPQFANPKYDADKKIAQMPIYSGHFRKNKQVFWAYHWIVRMDGSCERLLNDNETGWQAGNWDVNCRSVAIVLDNDYEDSEPSQDILKSLATLIKEKYPQVSKGNIIGHCEVNTKSTCPGKLFLKGNSESEIGWKTKLISSL